MKHCQNTHSKEINSNTYMDFLYPKDKYYYLQVDLSSVITRVPARAHEEFRTRMINLMERTEHFLAYTGGK